MELRFRGFNFPATLFLARRTSPKRHMSCPDYRAEGVERDSVVIDAQDDGVGDFCKSHCVQGLGSSVKGAPHLDRGQDASDLAQHRTDNHVCTVYIPVFTLDFADLDCLCARKTPLEHRKSDNLGMASVSWLQCDLHVFHDCSFWSPTFWPNHRPEHAQRATPALSLYKHEGLRFRSHYELPVSGPQTVVFLEFDRFALAHELCQSA